MHEQPLNKPEASRGMCLHLRTHGGCSLSDSPRIFDHMHESHAEASKLAETVRSQSNPTAEIYDSDSEGSDIGEDIAASMHLEQERLSVIAVEGDQWSPEWDQVLGERVVL